MKMKKQNIGAVILLACLVCSHAMAQAPEVPAPDANAAVLRELEQMRARIAELEALLKRQGQPEASLKPAVMTEPVSSNPQPVHPEKKKPPDPFAFPDFTWLNSNPRTKTPAFDSALFTPEL